MQVGLAIILPEALRQHGPDEYVNTRLTERYAECRYSINTFDVITVYDQNSHMYIPVLHTYISSTIAKQRHRAGFTPCGRAQMGI